jgi:hypothetical protein
MIEDGDTLAWLTPYAAVVRVYGKGAYSWEQLDESCCFCFSVDGKALNACARSHEHLLEICDVVLRLLAASTTHSIFLCQKSSLDGALINATILEYLMEQCQSLKLLSVQDLFLNENHIHVFGTTRRLLLLPPSQILLLSPLLLPLLLSVV